MTAQIAMSPGVASLTFHFCAQQLACGDPSRLSAPGPNRMTFAVYKPQIRHMRDNPTNEIRTLNSTGFMNAYSSFLYLPGGKMMGQKGLYDLPPPLIW